jgi:quinol monooxygenase YgiN
MTDNAGTPQSVFTGGTRRGNGTEAGTVFRHIILFKVYPGTDQTVIDEALSLMVAMCETPEVLHYEVGHSMDTRKGDILFEMVDYADEAAFEAFKATPAHRAYAAFISKHADWIIADYIVVA